MGTNSGLPAPTIDVVAGSKYIGYAKLDHEKLEQGQMIRVEDCVITLSRSTQNWLLVTMEGNREATLTVYFHGTPTETIRLCAGALRNVTCPVDKIRHLRITFTA